MMERSTIRALVRPWSGPAVGSAVERPEMNTPLDPCPRRSRFSAKLARAAMVIALALPPAGGCAESRARIDLGAYALTFEENFDELSVSAWGPASATPLPGASRWIAHTPWYGDFGDAAFADPVPGFPFMVDNGVLRIEARKGDNGAWRSGLLASTDPQGNGFAQKHGYFEMRAKFPSGPGVWPAFWLIANRSPRASAEIDIVEYYGQFTDSYQVVSHVWPKVPEIAYRQEKRSISVPPNSLTEQFHTYGVAIDAEHTVYFLDRVEVARTPTPPEHNEPMFILVNLALGSGWPIDQTPSPSYMYVDYIRAYARQP